MLSVMLQEMTFISVVCCRRLAENGNAYFCCSRYDVLLYDIAFIMVLKILFVAMFGVLSLLMLFLLCTVY